MPSPKLHPRESRGRKGSLRKEESRKTGSRGFTRRWCSGWSGGGSRGRSHHGEREVLPPVERFRIQHKVSKLSLGYYILKELQILELGIIYRTIFKVKNSFLKSSPLVVPFGSSVKTKISSTSPWPAMMSSCRHTRFIITPTSMPSVNKKIKK